MADSNALIEKVKAQFPGAVHAVTEFRGDTTLTVNPQHLLELCRFLRDDAEMQFNYLVFVAGVDYSAMGSSPRFATVYRLYSLSLRHALQLKVPLEGDNPSVPSV